MPAQIVRSRFPPAILAGLMLAAAFPKFGVAGFAWIAPALMLAAALGKRGAEIFRIGLVAGLAHYLVSLYWLLFIPYRWHGIPLGPALGWLLLCAYLALFPATWVWLCVWTSAADFQIADWRWSRRMLWSFSAAANWVAMEMLLARLLGGFPWDLLGVSQYRMVPITQFASVTGVYGVSFLVVWTSASLLCAAMVLVKRPNSRSLWLSEMLFPSLAVAAAFAFGFHKISSAAKPEREVKVTLVQPAIPQTLIWDESADIRRFDDLIRLSGGALTNEPDLLIWPESAIPRMLRYDETVFTAVTNLARTHHVWMIVGSDDAEPGDASQRETIYFNSSFLVDPDGQIVGRYCKRNLVIFGEYVPLARWLPFLKWFTPIDGGFTPGAKAVQFEMKNLRVKTAPLICFEDTFPGLARTSADGDTDFLVNLTNDGWFGESAAQWQHAATASFRAIENGLPLVRCANTGITCWIDESGTFREIFAGKNGSVYGPGFATFKVPLKPGHELTPYQKHGDWFGWICAAFAATRLAPALRRVVFRGQLN